MEMQESRGETGVRGMDILLVEDNPSYVDLTRRALREIGGDDLRVEFASDGEQALEIMRLEKSNPQLIISDISMPGMGGLEMLRRIRDTPATRYVPVVMLTSSARPSDIAASYRFGAYGYARRPMNFQSYIKTLADIIAYWLVINVSAPQGDPGIAPSAIR